MSADKISIIFPKPGREGYRKLPEYTLHDLGLDAIVKLLSKKEMEQNLILNVMTQITADPAVANYRQEVFDDIYRNKAMRDELMEILEKIDFLRDYGAIGKNHHDTASAWELMHRLEEINDYIKCVEAITECLSKADIHSEGLLRLRDYTQAIYGDRGFAELKADIARLKATTSDLKSVTLGINLNDRYEAASIGLVSINNKPFKQSGIIGNFSDFISKGDNISDTTDWNEDYKYHEFSLTSELHTKSLERVAMQNFVMQNALAMVTMASVPARDSTEEVPMYMDRITNHMLSLTVKKLREVLNKYVTITITDMTDLIPEFIYYIRWAEYYEQLQAAGAALCKPRVMLEGDNWDMHARGIYNLKLVATDGQDRGQVVVNDLDFDQEHLVYILTGANRGGKTTITQAIGQLFVLAQGGVYVPGDSFEYVPVDSIYTHFPADEDKTLDLGRLGEECKRFKELYSDATSQSLLLLNETFSTTSFEEGYYIAFDSVKAILNKGVRTIYNTHMHKLAFDIHDMNACGYRGRAQSLVVRSEADGKRCYKVEVTSPVGKSFASDIARKYGVTYDLLTGGQSDNENN